MENEFLLEDRLSKIRSVDDELDLKNNAYVSYSGGKDSSCLSKLIDLALPENAIPRVFVNTGLEYSSVLIHVRKLAETDKRIVIINAGVDVRKTLESVGYPFKSKDFSRKVDIYQRNGITKTIINHIGKGTGAFNIPKKLEYIFSDCFKLRVSDKCCHELKIKPMNKYEKRSKRRIAITGIRADEGGRRMARAGEGCIVFKNKRVRKFHPLIVCGNQFIDWFIEKYNISLPDIYKYLDRTGCRGCPFNRQIRKAMIVLRDFYPAEYKAAWSVFKPVYDEYNRINYRLKMEYEPLFC